MVFGTANCESRSDECPPNPSSLKLPTPSLPKYHKGQELLAQITTGKGTKWQPLPHPLPPKLGIHYVVKTSNWKENGIFISHFNTIALFWMRVLCFISLSKGRGSHFEYLEKQCPYKVYMSILFLFKMNSNSDSGIFHSQDVCWRAWLPQRWVTYHLLVLWTPCKELYHFVFQQCNNQWSSQTSQIHLLSLVLHISILTLENNEDKR